MEVEELLRSPIRHKWGLLGQETFRFGVECPLTARCRGSILVLYKVRDRHGFDRVAFIQLRASGHPGGGKLLKTATPPRYLACDRD
jgi:hypothetical protein